MSSLAAWTIVALATAGVIIRPFKWPEAVWAVGGAVLVLIFGLIPLAAGGAAVMKGMDVYLFLTGMMLLSEVGRREGLFDWIAAFAVNHARGSPRRLFVLVYLAGVVTTTFLSNDATAVVLTPAVFAVARRARAEPLPLLFVCAFIANAASFVLPISNPANIVLYGSHVPPLGTWLKSFGVASAVSIVVTFACLYATQRSKLAGVCQARVDVPRLSSNGRLALAGTVVTAIVLMAVSACDGTLGLPTAAMGVLVASMVCLRKRESPAAMMSQMSWSILPLVAGLFVLVETLVRTGVIDALAHGIGQVAGHGDDAAAWLAAGATALASNLANNLPVGLVASATLAKAQVSQHVVNATLVGVDLGPNLSITGSLATILWLNAIRREGADVGFWAFLKVGVVVMVPALLFSVCALLAV
ncbi:arsenic transporter [Pinirhizobacter sp.]|jgi:arsenical pump membrane protein|uniref:arsenic transporter n=1 Tax=Pinirhizobacter sp. TaxID=2950432 RepID=UPI002F418145